MSICESPEKIVTKSWFIVSSGKAEGLLQMSDHRAIRSEVNVILCYSCPFRAFFISTAKCNVNNFYCIQGVPGGMCQTSGECSLS